MVGSLAAATMLVGCTAGPAPLMTSSSTPPPRPPVLSTTATPASSPAMSAAARKYLEAALDIIQSHALNRARLNWPKIRGTAERTAAGAVEPSDTYPAVASALAELDDNGHSRFVPRPERTRPSGPLGPSQLPSGRLLPGAIGYISLPGNSEEFADQYQAAGTALMRRLQVGHPTGWILDLRNNNGGDVWPMLGGVQPLLGSGPIGSFVSPPAPPQVIRMAPTEIIVDGEVVSRMAAAAQDTSSHPVVVLTGPVTASAGELVAIAFRGRPCSASMGSRTQGVPTGNHLFELSDGAQLILTMTAEADRTGHVYPDAPVAPDVEVGTNYNATWNAADPTIQAACRWLSLHHTCGS